MIKRKIEDMTFNDYVTRELNQAKDNAERGIDSHGREIHNKQAYIIATRNNAEERWFDANNTTGEEWFLKEYGGDI
jgi:hypothetical protein